MQLYGDEDRSRQRSGVRSPDARCRFTRLAAFPLDEILVLTDQELEVLLFFGGELHEDLLAFRILEPFAVFPEETMRSALAGT